MAIRSTQSGAPSGASVMKGCLMASFKDLSSAEIAIIKARILRGDKYQDIAADYRLNQGRIADLKFGRKFPHVPPADLSK
jgi:hypothetical protein